MNKNKKNQAIAVTVAASLLVGGTLAWQSFSQAALNESAGIDGDVGARLHNDFNGSNADVYVENYASEEGTTVYTRVRLHEYMEIGTDAGDLDDSNTEVVKVDGDISSGVEKKITDPLTWDVHAYNANDEGTIGNYVSVNYGDFNSANNGRKVYMPTFNKDMDSTYADIKGTLFEEFGNRREGQFESGTLTDVYAEYTIGETLSGIATYSAFSEVAAQNSGATEIPEIHTAKSTAIGRVISMTEWIADGSQAGNYWVYDDSVDGEGLENGEGWFYWVNDLLPETATGLLVDSVSIVKEADEDYHYGLHVVMEAASAGDWGSEDDSTGFYKNGISTDALSLLDKIAEISDPFENIESKEDTVETVKIDGVTWYVLEVVDNKQTYVENGLDEEGNTIYIEGEEVKAALLWASDVVNIPEQYQIGDAGTSNINRVYYQNRETGSSSWVESYARKEVLATLYKQYTTIQSKSVCVELITDGYYKTDENVSVGGFETETSYDNLFLLSQSEFLEHVGLGDELGRASALGIYWLRTPYSATAVRAIYGGGVDLATSGSINAYRGIRPAVWVTID